MKYKVITKYASAINPEKVSYDVDVTGFRLLGDREQLMAFTSIGGHDILVLPVDAIAVIVRDGVE